MNGLQQVRLFGFTRHAKRGAATLHVKNNHRQLGRDGEAKYVGH